MKRSRFSEEQIIGILKEHHAGLSAAELCRKQGSAMQRFTNGDRSMAAWKYLTRTAKGARGGERKLKKLLAESMLDVSTLREMLGKNF